MIQLAGFKPVSEQGDTAVQIRPAPQIKRKNMKNRIKKLHNIIDNSIHELNKNATSFHAKIRIVEIVQDAHAEIEEIEEGLRIYDLSK